MFALPAGDEPGVQLVIGLSDHRPLLTLIARLALAGETRVIVGGNRFNAHVLARLVRRQTVHVRQVLARVQLARPFTCYQALALLEQTGGQAPLVALDLLATFYDENISDQESARLAKLAAAHLQQYGRQAPVLVTLRPPPAPARQHLTRCLRQIADQVHIYTPATTPVQATLW